MAVFMQKAIRGTVPSYLSQLVRVAGYMVSVPSALLGPLLVPSVKLSTISGWAFPVTGPTIYSSLSHSLISAPSLSTFF